MTTFAEKAKPYVDIGWPVIPQARNKVPLVRGWRRMVFDQQYFDETIMGWDKLFPYANVALLTGSVSQVVVIDLDGEPAVYRWAELCSSLGLKPDVPTVITQRGMHLYYHWSGYVKSSSPSPLGKGIDIRAEGGLATLPPSVHASGHVYRWKGLYALAQLPVLPMKILRMLKGKDPFGSDRNLRLVTEISGEHAIDKLRMAAEGGRNRALYNASCVFGKLIARRQIDEFTAFKTLQTEGLQIGLDRAEVVASIRSGLRDGRKL